MRLRAMNIAQGSFSAVAWARPATGIDRSWPQPPSGAMHIPRRKFLLCAAAGLRKGHRAAVLAVADKVDRLSRGKLFAHRQIELRDVAPCGDG